MADDELYDEEGRTPSQAAMDQQSQGQEAAQQVANQYYTGGQVNVIKDLVAGATQTGGDREDGRELLGRLDAFQADQSADDPVTLYEDAKRYIRIAARGPERAAPATPSPKTAPSRRAKSYGELTSEERQAMSSADIDKMTARQAGKSPSSRSRVISKRMGS